MFAFVRKPFSVYEENTFISARRCRRMSPTTRSRCVGCDAGNVIDKWPSWSTTSWCGRGYWGHRGTTGTVEHPRCCRSPTMVRDFLRTLSTWATSKIYRHGRRPKATRSTTQTNSGSDDGYLLRIKPADRPGFRTQPFLRRTAIRHVSSAESDIILSTDLLQKQRPRQPY